MSLLRLWTLQAPEVWQALQEQGVYRCPDSFVWEELRAPYRWLAGEMARRGNPPPEPGISMIWAWHRWGGKARPRPDMRHSGHAARGEPLVLLELLVPEDQALLSDLDAWHAPLNCWYLATSDEDFDRFNERHKQHPEHAARRKREFLDRYPPELQREVRDSWQAVFDLELTNDFFTAAPDEKRVQATMWELRREWVKSARHYTAR